MAEDDLKISGVMKKALDDFERVELEFDIEKPQAERIAGKLTIHRRDPNNTEH